jgi:asparagine synthase (glutamine-hydrolysing)
MLVCGLTRGQVKVALSGDGGDEAFAGYPKHRLRVWQQFPLLSHDVRERITRNSIEGTSVLPNKLRRMLVPETPSLFSGEFFSGTFFPQITTELLRAQSEAFIGTWVAEFWRGEMESLERILQWDVMDPLPNSLLTKLDICSMARSLEVRSPFLDHELMELCARLPNEWKVNGSQGKLILRDIVAEDLPREVLQARKRGFSVPLAQWWRGDARETIRKGILPLHHTLQPFLREDSAAQLLGEHQAGRANHAQRLWNLWVLNEWARTFLS